jgi:hypothetical protein
LRLIAPERIPPNPEQGAASSRPFFASSANRRGIPRRPFPQVPFFKLLAPSLDFGVVKNLPDDAPQQSF